MLIFGLPVFRGVYNLGNYTGIAVSFILIIYAITFSEVNKWICKAWGKGIGKTVLSLIAIIASIIMILAIYTTVCMVSGVKKKTPDGAVLIVLGGEVRGESPSLALLERLEVAKDYLDTHPEALCIVSGGLGDGENISEAECMSRWLIQNHIAEERIYKEDKSTDTDENIRFSKEIMDREHLGSKVAIATSEFHEYRAGKIAEKYDLEHGSVPAKTAWWMLPTFWVREMYGILAEILWG